MELEHKDFFPPFDTFWVVSEKVRNVPGVMAVEGGWESAVMRIVIENTTSSLIRRGRRATTLSYPM